MMDHGVKKGVEGAIRAPAEPPRGLVSKYGLSWPVGVVIMICI